MSLWDLFGASGDPFETAAMRQRSAVRPSGGRPEGGITDALTNALPDAYRYADNLAQRAFQSAQHRADGGDYNPAPFVETAANMIGFGGPAAMAGATGHLGAAGGKGIRAYHGSPHDFDRFDMSKIGTGEGAQVYGHGLYFAENEGVARYYKAAGQPSYVGADRIQAAQDLLKEAGGDRQRAIALADQRMKNTTKYGEGKLWIDVVNNFDQLVGKTPGKMYEVNINAAPEQFLDWDKPLSVQSSTVQDAVKRLAPQAPEPKSGPAKRNREAILRGEVSVPGDILYNNLGGFSLPGETSQAFRDAGIPGIKYLDQGSRGTGAGTSNYVLFRDDIIDILKKYGLAGMIGGPAMLGMNQPAPVSGMSSQ